MQKAALLSRRLRPVARPSAPTSADLRHYAHGWILDGEFRQLSPETLANRRLVLDKLEWFLREGEFPLCDSSALREFLAYVSRGSLIEGGARWGNAERHAEHFQAQPRTVKSYRDILSTFFDWCIREGLSKSPLADVPAPKVPHRQVQPFTTEQVTTLLGAAKNTAHPLRDHAIVLFLLDTGIRATELCGITISDVDITNRFVNVLGKGRKRRSVPFGLQCTRALWRYLQERTEWEPDEPVFLAARGAGKANMKSLTRSGLLQLIGRLGESSGITSARCSPHTFRHTFAIQFLVNGGNVFALQQILGHTDLKICQTYVKMAQADVAGQHKRNSPADRLLKR